MPIGGHIADLAPGDEFPAVEFRLTPYVVERYCDGVAESALSRLARQSWPREAAPPTLVHVAKFRLMRRHCPLGPGPTANLHYRYHARHRGLLHVGQTLVTTGRVADRYDKRGREYLEIAVELRENADGPPLIEYTNTTVLSFSPRTSAGGARAASAPSGSAGGTVVDTRTITAEAMSRYSDAMATAASDSGEPTPAARNIHNDEDFARHQQLRGVVADGMISTNWISARLTEMYGADYLTDGELLTTYVKPVYDGERLTVRFGIETCDPEGPRLRLDVGCFDDKGAPKTIGNAAISSNRLPTTDG